jgi:hypothetical protein
MNLHSLVRIISLFTTNAKPRLAVWLLLCTLMIAPAWAQNVALGKPAISNGAIYAGYPASNINDGNVGTFSHPDNGSTTGFYYQIDLGQEYALHHLSVVNRGDGCCPERLTNYQLTLYSDAGGSAGSVLWQASVRSDGTNSGSGGTDTVLASASTNPAHVFRGRYLRLTNLSSAAYNPQLAELQAWVVSANANLALGRPVTASGALWPGMAASNLTDGNAIGSGTIAHPDTGATLGFYYQVDLGAEYSLARLVIYNRSDCCPERLSNYRVSLYADNAGVPGSVLWQATVRGDGSNSGMAGADTVVASASTNPAHLFKGRFLRIENLSGIAYNPQIAEIEAYPEPPPVVNYFLTSAGNINGPGLPTNATLSWSVTNATTVSISGLGNVALTGSMTVTPASTTTYTLNAIRANSAAVTATLTVAVNAVPLPPRITEFQAADGLLEDEDGDRPDWIELFNPNSFTLNLADYRLTDDAALPARWAFPLANIAPGGYLVVYASGKDRKVAGARLHTNFSLSASGEYLGLYSPTGTLIQQFPPNFPTTLKYPRQKDRVSYGLDSTNAMRYFSPATPGQVNGFGYAGVVADTTFSVKRGIYSTAQVVTLASPTPGATIVYTTNGSAPSLTNGTQVPPADANTSPTIALTLHPGAVPGGAIGVNIAPTNGTTVLRAAAFKTGLLPTNVDTNTYVFPASVVTSSVMSTTITQDITYGPQMQAALTDVPSISVVTPATIVDGTSALCSFEYLPTAGAGVQENAGVEHFGGAFTGFQKKSFRVSFTSEFGATKLSVPDLFTNHARGMKPVGKFDQLELRNGSHDMAQRGFYMSNIFTDGTMLDMGNLAPHSRFVHLYLNGTYWGLYHLRERWSAQQQSAYLGGPASDYESINGNWNVGGWADPGTAYDGDGSSWTRVKTLRANYASVRSYLDVKDYIDYMLLFLFGNSEDEYRIVSPKEVGSGFKFMLNDADGFLGTPGYIPNVPVNRVELRSNPNVGRQNGDGPGSIFSQLWQEGNSEYKMLLADRIHQHLFNSGALSASMNQTRLTGMCDEIQRAFYAESARWVAGGESRTPDTWASDRNYILNTWFPLRTTQYLGHLQSAGYYPTTAAPAFAGTTVATNTTVSFPVAGATVYCTTDGSDPRLPGGGVNPTALTTSSLLITKNTTLRSRAISGSTWSALNEGFFTVTTPLAPGEIVFSEIHFNPQGDDDSEFIELLNPTDHAVNLRGAKFTVGLSFDFPDNRDVMLAPGQRLVLVSSLYNFQKRYGIDVPVAGVYFNRLGNDGDTLTLSSSTGTPLFSLQYQDVAPWPETADGNGYSLVLANPNSPAAPESWRTSTTTNGNPGTSDITVYNGPLMDDADHDGIPAMVEHFLATTDSNGSTGLPNLVAGHTPDGRQTLTFPRRLSVDGLQYVVEVSPDLVTWTADTARTRHSNLGDGTATETWTANTAEVHQYMRLRVTKP